MFRKFYPDEYRESAYVLDYEKFYREGYRGIIFDIDNTLVPHGAPADEKSIALFGRLREIGFDCVLLSNNKEPRVKPFAGAVGARYIYKAGKPAAANYRRAMEMMGTDQGSTLFVGDQLFTDVWGAKNAGIHSILVKPIDPREEIQIVLKRYLERIVLYFYRKERKAEHD
ncbi:MAG TPA: YqeG family HAD IIIA-type phosphatase [Candidatus Eisenbergiella merdipullorum]|uniref:YqeG family HAD IIIA-type phosphatase n=1 Tax=Candidatus Eisenbergiella merdipullorum TaxID=2838553 RepID=A0A9D2I588_9FIRM|nr:YqeG family HAD IIIA-type phosphatase [Candidatus Eisenbergiella merdipullorum]